MFGGQPQISDDDIRKYNLMTQRTLQNALYIAIGLWTGEYSVMVATPTKWGRTTTLPKSDFWQLRLQ